MSPTVLWKSLEAWAGRNWPLLSALGYALAFAVMVGGVALAAYTSDFAGPLMSLVCGGIAIWLMKFYARGIRALQRLIERLHPPESGETRAPAAVPGWAVAIYMLIGLALAYWVGAQEHSYTYAAMELFIGWAAGQDVLKYLFARQSDPSVPSAFATIDDALDRLAEPRRPLLRAIGIGLGFAALSGGVALYARQAGVTRVAAAASLPIIFADPKLEQSRVELNKENADGQRREGEADRTGSTPAAGRRRIAPGAFGGIRKSYASRPRAGTTPQALADLRGLSSLPVVCFGRPSNASAG